MTDDHSPRPPIYPAEWLDERPCDTCRHYVEILNRKPATGEVLATHGFCRATKDYAAPNRSLTGRCGPDGALWERR